MKKGFTLVELLMVIIIIGMVSLIVFPIVVNSIKNSRQNLYDIQIKDIKQAALKWATDHIDYLDETHLNTVGLPLTSLGSSEYLQDSKIIDPRDKSVMKGCIVISYNDTTSQYQYEYTESTCDKVVEHGMIYTYESGSWKKEEIGIIETASSAIINYYIDNHILKVDGETIAGLYDEGERYIFRGLDVNNYVKLSGGSEVYRILSIDKITNNIRLLGTTAFQNVWDNENGTLFENASVKTVQLESYYNGSSNGILDNTNKIVTDALWNTAEIIEDSSYMVLKSLEKGRTVYSKIGLPSISDYVGASLSAACHASILSSACKEQNYLYELWKAKNNWLINTDGTSIWYVDANGALNREGANTIKHIYPVIEVKNVSIQSGVGSAIAPYLFG